MSNHLNELNTIDSFHTCYDYNPTPFALLEIVAGDESDSYVYRYVNPAFIRLFHAPWDTIKDQAISSIPARSSVVMHQLLEKAVATKEKQTIEHYDANADRYYRIVIFLQSDCYCAFRVEDITEQKKLEKALTEKTKMLHEKVDELEVMQVDLRESKNRYIRATKSIGLSVLEYDMENRSMVVLDESTAEEQGISRTYSPMPEAMIDSGFIHEESLENFRNFFARIHAGEAKVTDDFYCHNRHTNDDWYMRISFNVVYEEGNPIKAYGTGQDVTSVVTAIKRYEDAMKTN